MLALAFRASIAGALFSFIPLLVVTTADAAPSDGPEQKRIEQAYANRMQVEQEKARNQLILGKTTALLNDPATPVIGNPQADVAIIEFFDYTCPYCKAVEPRLERLLKDDKRVKLVVKEFPILTPESLVASKVALAAVKQGKYEQFHNILMNFKGRLTNDVIFETAKDVGLDVARLRKDMDAPEITNEIIANFNLARGLRIFQTPAFIVDGQLLTGESADIDFPKVVAAARAK